MVMCSLEEKDRTVQDTNGMIFLSSDGFRKLCLSFPAGVIRYETVDHHYGPTNLAKGVPEMSRMPELTTDFLAKVGISLSDIEKNLNGAPNFDFWEPLKLYFLKSGTITNIEFRAVVFSRSVDGAKVIGDAGHCGLEFGEHGKISQIHLSWPDLNRYESRPTLKPRTMLQLLRQGKARLGFRPDNFRDTDWAGVKSVTIKKAIPSYYAGSSDWLYPYIFLWATVETGHDTIEVEIHCPIIDESKP